MCRGRVSVHRCQPNLRLSIDGETGASRSSLSVDWQSMAMACGMQNQRQRQQAVAGSTRIDAANGAFEESVVLSQYRGKVLSRIMAHFPCRMSRLISSARQLVVSSQTLAATSSRTPSIASSISSSSSSSPSLGRMHALATPIIFAKHGIRSLSTVIMPVHKIEGSGTDFGATSSLLPIPPQADAENFAAYAHANRHQKVKPFIIKRRIKQLRTYIGDEKNIRHSPWRMNLVCQFAAGLTVPEALKQLMFCQKRMAPLVAKVIRDTANTADRQDGLQPSQLEVAECFSTHGTHLKRLKIMGRGRAGKKHRRHSHIRLVLREIDFPTKLLEAKSINQKRKWLEYLRIARDDYEKAKVDRAELAELEAMAAQLEEEARKKREEEAKW